MSDVFNETELMDRVDGDLEFLAETIAMLDEDSPALLEQLHVAAEGGDAAALGATAHALKGMLANFCAPAAEAAALELERMGREQRLDDVGAAVVRARAETERVRAALNEFLRTRTT
ncbi:MAG: Hpt domain-containing protein [Planctomycetota bacterium]